MMPQVVRSIDCDQPDHHVIDEVVRCLLGGGLVVAPTETRYGLLVRADNEENLKRMYDLKHRDLKLPTALFVADMDAAGQCGEVTPIAEALADEFLPGPLTLVLKSVTDWPAPRVSGGKIGLRISSAPVIRRIISQVPFPLSATSANVSGAGDPVVVEDALRAFGEGVDIYLDAGRIDGPLSTVVDCSSEPIRIVRDGAIPREAIARVAGGTVI
jgi:L-threonylcarbamoyladenylate synthase